MLSDLFTSQNYDKQFTCYALNAERDFFYVVGGSATIELHWRRTLVRYTIIEL